MNDMSKAAAEPDYSATLFLPQTDFPMRAGLPEREPTWLKRWEDMDIYGMQRQAMAGKPLFTLHDGPPMPTATSTSATRSTRSSRTSSAAR